MAQQAPDYLSRVFQDLRSKYDEVRQKAAYDLRAYLVTAARELPQERFQDCYGAVIVRISNFVQSSDSNERIGGILALDRLIDFDDVDLVQKITRFSSNLRNVMRGNDNAAMILAARALGRLAVPGGSLTAELVDSEVTSALEWLQSDRQESRRFAAVLTLREFARNAPTLVVSYVTQIFELIWVALRDPKVLIRETAAETISICFEILSPRDPQVRHKWLTWMFEEAFKGLRSNAVEVIHGSLLTLKELLEKGGMFMLDFYSQACDVALRLKDHREPLIRRQIILLIPVLAEYAPTQFAEGYLERFMQHLLAHAKREKDKNPIIVAIGKIASAVHSSITPYLDDVLVLLREGLTQKAWAPQQQLINITRLIKHPSRIKTTNERPIFECISLLSIAVGQALGRYMDIILEQVFACELSESLTQALVDMAHYIPPIKPRIQERLLDLLSKILCGRPFDPLGNPTGPIPLIRSVRDTKDPQALERREAEIALALHTLGSFDFSGMKHYIFHSPTAQLSSRTGHVLNEFVHDVAIQYVDHDNPEIRKAAALTCCQLFVRDPIVHQTSHHAIRVVSEVIEKLLTVCVGDPDADIRRTVLLSLDARFDRHLAKPENIRTLFLALNDDSFSVREATIPILGRLSVVNPAHVFPSLRKVLIGMLTELHYSSVNRHKEEDARLLGLLFAAAGTLMEPFVYRTMENLLPSARDENKSLATTAIKTLGDLANSAGECMLPHVDALMPIIIDALQDLSSQTKREAALRTLGQLAGSAGYVIQPYFDHPKLLTLLINIVKTEQTGSLRKETIKTLGILGALDPYKHQQILVKAADARSTAEADRPADLSVLMAGLTPSHEEYYPQVAIGALIAIIKDSSLSNYNSAVIDALMNIFKTSGLKCIPFLPAVIPAFLIVIKSAAHGRLESYFSQLAVLVTIVRNHIRPFIHLLLELIKQYWYWQDSGSLRLTILQLIESLARALQAEFGGDVAEVMPYMLNVLETDATPGRLQQQSERVLQTLLALGNVGELYLNMMIPAFVRLFEKQHQPVNLRKQAIETIGKLSRYINITDYAAGIIHPLTRILASGDHQLRQAAMDTLCALVFQQGIEYLPFVATVKKVMVMQKITHTNYDLLVSKLQKGESIPDNFGPDDRYREQVDEAPFSEVGQRKQDVNQVHLKNAWEASQKSTRDDWQEWIRRFSVELLRESPAPALRACAGLAGMYYPLARDLFNAAFISCYTEMYPGYQEECVRALELAITSPNIPPEILQILLNLAEFMEHDDKALSIDIGTLGGCAAKCHAYAKALHYKELEFLDQQSSSAVEALISINNQLQQSDAAIGILRKAQGYQDVTLKETWFEKLHRWEEALQAYQRREQEGASSLDITMGKMRCLHALGEWDLLSTVAQEKWTDASADHRRALAPLAAAAAWGLGQWELMENYLTVMKPLSTDRSFFAAILALHRDQFEDAAVQIEHARDGLDTELSALVGESYNRAYSTVVRVQMLAELEEIITYKQNLSHPVRLETIRTTWVKRLKGCARNVEDWERTLKVRALVISPKDNMEMWIKFANLCRKSARYGLAEKALNSLIGPLKDRSPAAIRDRIAPPIVFAQLKYLWDIGQQREALTDLKDFTLKMSTDLEAQMLPPPASGELEAIEDVDPAPVRVFDDCGKLLSRCFLKQGEWQIALQKGDWHRDRVADILSSYSAATRYNRKSYKAWHNWALANFEVVTAITSQAERETVQLPQDVITNYVIPAIRGFFKSISLSSGSSLQDTLRLLTLWFAHGGNHEVHTAIAEGLSLVNINTWLGVIPQLIARISQPNARVRQSIHNLLAEVGRAHPQALVYPLAVALKSNLGRRSRAAGQIMDSLREHSPKLVQQAEMVSRELVRVAVLWHELWHEGLEESSRLYFGDNDVRGMLATLEPLHDMMTKGPETLREESFIQTFGHELTSAKSWCAAYTRTGQVGHLNAAWDLYYSVFRRIARQLPQMMMLDLMYVSPKLEVAKHLELAVPGTYQAGKPIVRIESFVQNFNVIASKQRPRKISLKGSDGTTYTYVLKGHEDIRQDERVMQLFGLVNTLLGTDPECFKRHLDIQQYPVIPLSQSSGLLGWVPNSDTFHQLIREYREGRKILLNIEHRIMLQMAPDYESLTLMQKVEVFTYALDNTTGQDLYRLLWLKSKSSEAWLDRRTNYTRSLAVMSMVGYILGLGDRHPSNLMLDRITGKVIHIDFGDCFEVAMHRDKYPERVPFRLTRMLTYAMEVSNIEGSFRLTCEAVMRVLRDNKESVMAVLEAFVHDPLLNWRLTNRESPGQPSFPSERRQSLAAVTTGVSSGISVVAAAGGDDTLEGRETYRPRARSNLDPETEPKEVQNARALQVLSRVREKLTGCDFRANQELNVPDQVDRLLLEATDLENLCQHYIGWCSFW
ncbi:MAG: phosphatidylinositol kinase- protein kinase tor1 [Phylliscum demangeonii]|nr:MAG: phosphatidylinositol kinase- protein kinase tor1 [Phylliscum demangeonii]